MSDGVTKNIDFLKEFMQSDTYKQQEKLLAERAKTLKKGSNVVHIDYYEGIIDSNDLTEYSELLEKNDLQLSSYNKHGIAYASFDDYTNQIFIAINGELIKNILFGIAGNAIWDIIKTITKSVHSKIKNKKLTKLTTGKSQKQDVTFGMNMSLDKNTSFNFRIDQNLSLEEINIALDQATEFIKNQKLNEEFEHPMFVYFDNKNKKWISVNMFEDIREKIALKKKASKSKKKK